MILKVCFRIVFYGYKECFEPSVILNIQFIQNNLIEFILFDKTIMLILEEVFLVMVLNYNNFFESSCVI